MTYKTLRYSAIVIFALFIAIIFYSTYMWQSLTEQGDFLQQQENELSEKIRILERNEKTRTVDTYDTIGYPPLSSKQELELKKLRNQYETIKLQAIQNKGQGNFEKRDLLSAQVNELYKKIAILERNQQTITIEGQTVTINAPLSSQQQLEVNKLRGQRDEIHQSLKDLGRWDRDKRKRISLSRFGDAAKWIILPYFIFLIPILLSYLWEQLAHKRAFIGSCVAACYSGLPIYFYSVLFPVKHSHGYGYITVIMIAAFALILGIITFIISYIVIKRVQKSNS